MIPQQSPLRPYQEPHAAALFQALRIHRSALDASDMGTGKTHVACALARRLGVTPLVLCPKSVVADWRATAALHGIEVDALGYEKVRGACTYETLIPDDPDGIPRRVRRSGSEYGEEKVCPNGSAWKWKHEFALGIFDEVDRCGGMTSLQSKMLIAARRQFGSVICLSATAADSPLNMRALGFTLGLFELREFKWWAFRHGIEPGIHGGFHFTDDPEAQREAMRKLHEAIFPAHGARMRKAEIPGFPKTQIEPHLLDDEKGRATKLAGDIRQLYLKRKRRGAAVEDDNPLEAIMRKRQALELLKVPDMVELARHYSRKHPVAVFVNFRDTLAALRLALERWDGNPVPAIYGDNTEAERAAIARDFRENRIPILLLIADAGGIGLSLHDPTGRQERTALISPGWKARVLRQVFGRLPRDGGAFSQQFLIFFAEGVEAEIAARVRASHDNIDLFNDDLLHGVWH